MSQPAIIVEGISKRYRLGHANARHQTFREMATGMLAAPFRKLRAAGEGGARGEEFWALKDVNFEVQPGEVVGIIGRNGAGKSTLLKILSRITEPTSGQIRLRGRVASLLEVGTGFHPELTGRENIYLNGAILGMKRAEITKKFDEIVAFAETEKFLDTPVKFYSSGMYVRLAFAVAAHLEPEILIVDEVLAVGDAEFQKKCLGKMKEVSESGGRTVLFVSHNMAAVRTLCTQAMLLESGRSKIIGGVDQCINAYIGTDDTSGSVWESSGTRENPLAIMRVESQLKGSQPTMQLELIIDLESNGQHLPAMIAVDITDIEGVTIMQAIPALECFIRAERRTHRLCITVELPPLIPGIYTLDVWVGPHNAHTYDVVKRCISFEVVDSPSLGRTFPHTRDHGFVVPNSKCEVLSLLHSTVI